MSAKPLLGGTDARLPILCESFRRDFPAKKCGAKASEINVPIAWSDKFLKRGGIASIVVEYAYPKKIVIRLPTIHEPFRRSLRINPPAGVLTRIGVARP